MSARLLTGALHLQVGKIVGEDLEYILSSRCNWSVFYGKNIMITGGYGMLLPYITYVFLRLNERFNANIKITIVVNNMDRAVKRFGNDNAIRYLNIKLDEEIRPDEKVDFIFHAASPAVPRLVVADPKQIFLPNIQGTYNLLELARIHRVESMLYFSSGAVYGRPLDLERVSESDYGYLDPLDVNNAYGESKRIAENMCSCWASVHSVPVKMVRPAHVYGPTMDIVNDSRIVAAIVRQILSGVDITLKTSGEGYRSFCYIADAAVAFFRVLINGEDGSAYNIGNDNNYMSIRSLAEIAARLYGRRVICELGEMCQTSGCDRMLMVSDKVALLGWSCRYDIEEGLSRTVSSFKNRGNYGV